MLMKLWWCEKGYLLHQGGREGGKNAKQWGCRVPRSEWPQTCNIARQNTETGNVNWTDCEQLWTELNRSCERESCDVHVQNKKQWCNNEQRSMSKGQWVQCSLQGVDAWTTVTHCWTSVKKSRQAPTEGGRERYQSSWSFHGPMESVKMGDSYQFI